MDTLDQRQVSRPFDTIDRLLNDRHSCRAFLPRPVPREDIELLVRTAQKTASWCNTQPWQVVIASGEATEAYRQRLLAHAATHAPKPDIASPRYEGVYLDRRRVCGFALYESVGIARGDRTASAAQTQRNFHFFEAPHIAIISSPKSLGIYGAVDCGAYVANFILIAQSLGIATIPQAALAMHSDLVHEHFGIGDDRDIVCGISFGYEDSAHPANRFRTQRATIAESVHFQD
jgi:nitroreductase